MIVPLALVFFAWMLLMALIVAVIWKYKETRAEREVWPIRGENESSLLSKIYHFFDTNNRYRDYQRVSRSDELSSSYEPGTGEYSLNNYYHNRRLSYGAGNLTSRNTS
jgi:hypothetical protein